MSQCQPTRRLFEF